MSEPIAALVGVHKIYMSGANEVAALTDITLAIEPNCFTVLTGQSGSGKTTLLSIVGCIDRPTFGKFVVAGREVASLDDGELSDFRARNIGFIFQNFNLLSTLTCAENIEFPLLLTQSSRHQRRQRVRELLHSVGLNSRADHFPAQMSGGQRQRVAIARALASRPKLVLADEPTANLDSSTGSSIIALMREMQQREKTAFVFSSHDPYVLAQADRTVQIRDGRLVDEAVA